MPLNGVPYRRAWRSQYPGDGINDLMMHGNTLLMVGSSFPYSQFLPEFGRARGVRIDLDARLIGIRYPMEVLPVGDAASRW